MKLWEFIQGKLKVLGRSEAWLVDQGISQMTLNRIRAGGVIKDATKQKLALALGCSVGDINAAIATRDLPQPKASALVGEIPKVVEEVVDDMVENGSTKIPAEKIKLFKDEPAAEMPELDRGLLTKLGTIHLYDVNVEKYKGHLKNKLLKMMLDDTYASVSLLYQDFGKAVIQELLE